MQTEKLPPKEMWIDKLPNRMALKVMLENQAGAIKAVDSALEEIEKASEAIYNKLKENLNSRLIYVGAGTSARIGFQDGAELLPTFGWPEKRVAYLIAGGFKALTEAVENAEDNVLDTKKLVDGIKITSSDVVIALSASGTTPFTISVVNEANKKNVLTIGIGNNYGAELQKVAKFGITLNTGFEILAGSTRLKAGTAQKICLNMISTLVMSNLGNIQNGMMINLNPNNKKLKERYGRIKIYLDELKK